MPARVLAYLGSKERIWRPSYRPDHATPASRRWSRWHFLFVDQALLRIPWTNFHRVSEGVFRSNQPAPRRLKQWRDRGVKTVLNLRGASYHSHFLFESEACETLGLQLVNIKLKASKLPTRETLLELETYFRTLEKPFVMHCKSGADRAGFVSALYLLLIEQVAIDIAMAQLSFRYMHIRASAKGIFDYCLETYRRTNEASPIAFRDWMISVYDPEVILDAFRSERNLSARN
ncbi:MAG: tyrosine-protein phosphatase [Paracoccaceae bacterium]